MKHEEIDNQIKSMILLELKKQCAECFYIINSTTSDICTKLSPENNKTLEDIKMREEVEKSLSYIEGWIDVIREILTCKYKIEREDLHVDAN